MSQQHPQVLEPSLDRVLDGTVTVRTSLESMLRQLLVIRRRYNDPYQSGAPLYARVDGSKEPDPRNTPSSTYQGCLGGFFFSNIHTIDSQKARVEAGISFLKPIVGDTVGDYPPITANNTGTGNRVDAMGNFIPPGKP